MAFAEGKYQFEADALLGHTKASGTLVVVINGNRGTGASARLDPSIDGELLLVVLRTLVAGVEADLAALKQVH